MKKTDIILLSGLIGAIIFSNCANIAKFGFAIRNIREEVLRIHILANSDSSRDQELKIKVRDRLLSHSEDIFGGCDTLEEMRKCAKDNIEIINGIAQEVIDENGFDYKAQSTVVTMEFDSRTYGDITMPSGEYDALRITLGQAQGHNWWCVMYPPLCIPAAEEVLSDHEKAERYFSSEELELMENPKEYKVKFKCVELFRSIKRKISQSF